MFCPEVGRVNNEGRRNGAAVITDLPHMLSMYATQRPYVEAMNANGASMVAPMARNADTHLT